ncbi:MAG: hypothetical protein AB7O97_17135 [Planctomycetota bacterium]
MSAPLLQGLVVLAGYVLTCATSGRVVTAVIGNSPPPKSPPDPAATGRPYDAHVVIGKCENILTITFVLAGELTGLALIFGAKSLVRREEIHQDAGYYLGGTLVNLVWSLLLGFATRLVVLGVP